MEIGTGTGYNAALLAHRLGSQQVCSVDIDPHLVSEARHRLARLGYTPTVVAADGAEGLAEHAPFDRIIATCAVFAATGRRAVREAGPTPLWANGETAWQRWQQLGAPAWHEFGLTVTASAHHVWFRDPHHGPRWALPTPEAPARSKP